MTSFVFGTAAAETLTLPDGRDPAQSLDVVAYGMGGADIIGGGTGNDWIWGQLDDVSATRMTGGAGDDVLISWGQGATFEGGDGADILISSAARGSLSLCSLYGGAGDDSLWSLNAPASLYGADGDDILVGGMLLWGGEGADLVVATMTGSQVAGEDGDDRLWIAAGAGNVVLDGGAGRDVLVGAGGNSMLSGGVDTVTDVLIGGQGLDFFGTRGRPGEDCDLIWGFEPGTDRMTTPNHDDYLAMSASVIDRAFVTADGATGLLHGTLLTHADGSDRAFLVGLEATMAQLLAWNAFQL